MGIIYDKTLPGFANGFARRAAESERPDLWRGLCYAPAMFLGSGVGYDVATKAYGKVRDTAITNFAGQTAMGSALYSSTTASTAGAYWDFPKYTASQPAGDAAPLRPTHDYTILIWFKAIAWNSTDSFLFTIPYYINAWSSPYLVLWLFRGGSGSALSTSYHHSTAVVDATSANGMVDTSDTTNVNMYGATRNGIAARFYKNGRYHSSANFPVDYDIAYPWWENQYAIGCRGDFHTHQLGIMLLVIGRFV
jgi:hypothetical protein